MESSSQSHLTFNPENTMLDLKGHGKVLLATSVPPIVKSVVPYVKAQIRLCNAMVAIPYEWDEARGRMRLLKSSTKLKYCKFQLTGHIIYTIIMVLHFFLPHVQQSMKTSTRMMGLSFITCFVAVSFMRYATWKMGEDGVHIFNNYVLFEEKHLPPPPKGYKGDLFSRAFMLIGVLTSVGLPGFMTTMLLVDPCKPPHLAFILFAKDNGVCAIPNWTIRTAILIFDSWMWLAGISAAVFPGFQLFFPGLLFMSKYIKLISLLLQDKAKKLFRTKSEQDLYCIRVYNQLRILAKLFNFCLQDVFVPSQIGAACVVLIIGLFTCIKLHAAIPMPGFAFFPLLTMDGLVMSSLISQVAGGVYLNSVGLVEMVRSSTKYKRKSYFVKMVKATNYIKIRFGETNYIDQMTPLVFLNFCLNQTVSLLLVS